MMYLSLTSPSPNEDLCIHSLSDADPFFDQNDLKLVVKIQDNLDCRQHGVVVLVVETTEQDREIQPNELVDRLGSGEECP